MSGDPDLSLQNKELGRAGGKRVRTVFLVGFMGSGKTSVGLALAQLLGWRFQDLDDYIQQREGRTIAQIFDESGEAEFRSMERTAMRDLVVHSGEPSPTVLALGGGAFVQPEVAAILKDTNCPVVFLDAPVEELWRRCEEAVVRPMKRDPQQFRQLHESRRPHYMQATTRIETQGRSVEDIAAEIAARFELPPQDSAKEK
jgi:shikimate kinase